MNISKILVLAGGNIRCIRCTAMSKRTKLQCGRPALRASTTQKCQFHGGRGSGPKTLEGRARIGAAHTVHGNETNEKRRQRSQASLRLALIEDVMHVAGMTTAARTTGRKPSEYRPITTLEAARQFVAEDAVQPRKSPPKAC